MKKVILTVVMVVLTISVYAQKKTVILDVSHDSIASYTKVNATMFEQYKEIVGNNIGANLIINEDKELDQTMLAQTDVLIILSPLSRDRATSKNNLTPVERVAIVDYVKKGGKVILFMDEEHRVDMESFGGNDIVKPFGMEFGLDLPMKPDVGATSLIGEVISESYELSYSGSRLLTGGLPISLRNGEGEVVHGAYEKLENGGTIVAFGETMTGLFMGGVEMKMPNGMSITWRGKDDQKFIQELIAWLLKSCNC